MKCVCEPAINAVFWYVGKVRRLRSLRHGKNSRRTMSETFFRFVLSPTHACRLRARRSFVLFACSQQRHFTSITQLPYEAFAFDRRVIGRLDDDPTTFATRQEIRLGGETDGPTSAIQTRHGGPSQRV